MGKMHIGLDNYPTLHQTKPGNTDPVKCFSTCVLIMFKTILLAMSYSGCILSTYVCSAKPLAERSKAYTETSLYEYTRKKYCTGFFGLPEVQ